MATEKINRIQDRIVLWRDEVDQTYGDQVATMWFHAPREMLEDDSGLELLRADLHDKVNENLEVLLHYNRHGEMPEPGKGPAC